MLNFYKKIYLSSKYNTIWNKITTLNSQYSRKKLLFFFYFLFISFFSISFTNAVWVQEDTFISWKTTLENKVEFLKDITQDSIVSTSKIATNRNELLSLFQSWDLWSFLKDSYLDAIGNNLIYQDISWTLYQTYFWYKVVDWVKVISLKSDFLLEIQKNADWTFKDPTRTETIANNIVAQIQLYLWNYINAELWNITNYPKSYIKNHYSVITVWPSNSFALNRVFDQVCKKNVKKTICFEWTEWEIIAFWLRDQVQSTYTNQQEYEELVSRYTISWKVQLPTLLQSKLTASCPLSSSKTISRFIENWKLDECWLVAQDLNCDWVDEWVDYDKFNKTTTLYAINSSWDISDVKVILYLNNKQIVKVYTDSSWCYSNILTKDMTEMNSYKIISQWFSNWSWTDLSNFTTSNITENGNTLIDWKLTTKTKPSDGPYKFFTAKPLYVDTSSEWTYKIDVDVKDWNTWITNNKVLWNINLSTTNSIADKTVTFNLNQEKLGIQTATSEIKLDSLANWITNKNNSHYTLKFDWWVFSYLYNWKELFNYDSNNKTVIPKNWSKITSETNLSLLTSDNLKLQKYIIFSDHYLWWVDYSKEYSDYYVSKKDSSKLYLYKLNSWVSTNYYLGQVIDTTNYTYNFFDKWSSTDATCKSIVFKWERFFDNNRLLSDVDATATSYIGFNPDNGCNFRSQNISFYTDWDWKLSYLKKVKINGTYNKTLWLFEFVQSEDNSLQGVDFWTVLDSSLSNCTITQVINNELDLCSEMKPLDIDGDKWNEWVISRDWEFEIYNNIISQNTLGELVPKIELIFKSNWDTYCRTVQQDVEYYKYRSLDTTKTCKDPDLVDKDIATGWGTKENCMIDSAIVLNSIDNYQIIYGITWLDKNSKKYSRNQIISGWYISCN